jgi:uncharacterized protein (UPF0335 family)
MNAIDSAALIGIIEQLEAIYADIDLRKADAKGILTAAARQGLSPNGIKLCVKVRAQKPHDFQEAEQLRNHYLHAIGMADVPPLFRMMDALATDALGQANVLERFKALVPSRGEIIIRLPDAVPMRLWRNDKGEVQAEEAREPPPAPAAVGGGEGAAPGPSRPSEPPPAVDLDAAEELGVQAARDNKPIIANPFPFGDHRRLRWDVGWRRGAGNDGMGG